ncbi:MAG: hypothetical protein VXW65_07625 [Pseudomonadota bacterium]|nr:hypothetical protein [Pseudomonadota bacterium]
MSEQSRQEKLARIQELREAINQLEIELKREFEQDQHELVDHLEEHFDAVETRLSSLKTFWHDLIDDLTHKKK